MPDGFGGLAGVELLERDRFNDVGPRTTGRAGSVDRGRGGEREGGVDLRGGQGQRRFLVVSDPLVWQSATASRRSASA